MCRQREDSKNQSINPIVSKRVYAADTEHANGRCPDTNSNQRRERPESRVALRLGRTISANARPTGPQTVRSGGIHNSPYIEPGVLTKYERLGFAGRQEALQTA